LTETLACLTLFYNRAQYRYSSGSKLTISRVENITLSLIVSSPFADLCCKRMVTPSTPMISR
jgi:hypothetical protein